MGASAQKAIGSGTKQTSVCLRQQRLDAAVVQLCWVLALTTPLGGSQAASVHLYIDAGAISTDYDFTDSAGHAWSSDTSYTGGGTEQFGDSILGAPDGTGLVYQTNRLGGSFEYSFIGLQPSSTYDVTLLFCELYFTDLSARRFNVTFNGQQTLVSNFSIYEAAGGKDVAHDVTFNLAADPTGALTFQFVALINNALVSGFEIRDTWVHSPRQASGPVSAPVQMPLPALLQPALAPALVAVQAPAPSPGPTGAPVQAPLAPTLQPALAPTPTPVQAPDPVPAQPSWHHWSFTQAPVTAPVQPPIQAPILVPMPAPNQASLPVPVPAPQPHAVQPPAQSPNPAPAQPRIMAPAPAAMPLPPVPAQQQAFLVSAQSLGPTMMPSEPLLQPQIPFPEAPVPAPQPWSAQAPQQGQASAPAPALSPAAAPIQAITQSGYGIPTPAPEAINDASTSVTSTDGQVTTSTATTGGVATVAMTVTTEGPPATADSPASQQTLSTVDINALADSVAAQEDGKYVHFTKGQVACLTIGLWLGLLLVVIFIAAIVLLALKGHARLTNEDAVLIAARA